MEDKLFDNDHYNSYYYANIINNILTNDLNTIGFISAFKESYGESLLMPFQKKSAFHCFIAHVIYDFFFNDMHENDLNGLTGPTDITPKRRLYAEQALENFGLAYSFKDFIGDKMVVTLQDIEEYHKEIHITGYLEELFEKISREVFYLLFNNRNLLMRFNKIMKYYVEDIVITDIENEKIKLLFKNDGRLIRKRIPEWVKKAVFFRDRGHCCNCNKDITGVISISEKKHFDHIVPLKLGGINDVSNIQLLCERCNLKKGATEIYTSNKYEKWF